LKNLPTTFQKKTLWTAITAASLTVIGAIAVWLIYLGTQVMSFLQPVLVPFAVAGVLAYLLEPAVVWLEQRRLSRQRAVILVFAVFTLFVGGLGWWLGQKVFHQTQNLNGKMGVYAVKVRDAVVNFADDFEQRFGIDLLAAGRTDTSVSTDTIPAAFLPETEIPDPEDVNAEEVILLGPDFSVRALLTGEWMKKAMPDLAEQGWRIVKSSLGGFLGVFGLILSSVIVPLYLYYFLIESAKIKQTWSNYLPLRASAFKDELVDCLTEINGYLIAFFRGQLFVSLINGVATGIGLMIVGLDFGILIGLALCVLGIIPYLGIALCWIPAVVIAAVQGGSYLVPGDPWWVLPLVVSGIFIVVQQIDGFFLSPKIIGESVGLHPMTVIASMFVWSLLLGGLLGAILAVPLTASVKVVFQRYVWRAKLAPQTVGGARLAYATPPS